MLDPQQLDQQYNVRTAVPDHAEYLQRWAQRSLETLAQFRCEQDYCYGSSANETLDIFPASHADAPLLAFIPGAAWQPCDKRDFAFLAPAFVDAGVSLALLNHDPAAHASQAEIVQQMLRAVVWLWHNAPDLGIDPQRIYIGGHGAGAHQAAMLIAAQWPSYGSGLPATLLRGALCISGLYDLATPTRAPCLRDMLRLDEAAARQLSPVNYQPQHRLPLVTAVGELESAEFQRQNLLLAQAWPHCPVRNVLMPGHHHFSIIDALAERNSALCQAALKLIGI